MQDCWRHESSERPEWDEIADVCSAMKSMIEERQRTVELKVVELSADETHI
jgi:hypothetical protein